MYLIKQRLIRSSAYFVFGLHATLLLLAAPAARSQNSLPYKVGVAVENITPCAQNFTNCSPSDIPISSTVKTTGGSATVATGVGTDYDGTRSELTVRAFVIEDARGQRVVLISADLLGFSANFVRDLSLRLRRRRRASPPRCLCPSARRVSTFIAMTFKVRQKELNFMPTIRTPTEAMSMRTSAHTIRKPKDSYA